MSITAEGYLSLPLFYLANLIADSTRFQLIAGASDRAEALKRIHWPVASDRWDEFDIREDAWPRCMIGHGEGKFKGKGPGGREGSGVLPVCFEFVVPNPYKDNPQDAHIWFSNQVGVIFKECFDRRNQGGDVLHVEDFEYASPFPLEDDDLPEGGLVVYGVEAVAMFNGVP